MIDPKDQHNLKTRFPEECKRLPLGYLEPSEKELAEKCINHEEFTEEEVEELRELLARYREYFTKYDSVDFE